MITEDYVSFEVAQLLKEKGFDSPCMGRYSVRSKEFHLDCTRMCSNGGLFECAAPSQAMAMKWLREEKRTSIIIEFDLTKRGYCPYVHQLDYDMDWVVKWRVNTPMKYEEAVEAALKYVLENLI